MSTILRTFTADTTTPTIANLEFFTRFLNSPGQTELRF
jgi:hypothetical protein